MQTVQGIRSSEAGPAILFAPHRKDPFLYKAGDMIKFKPISRNEFDQLAEKEN